MRWTILCGFCVKGERNILVDTGYDHTEAKLRGRPIRLDPGVALAPLGLTPDDITEVIVTHLHYDYAGGLALFPNAHLHMQAAEMAFATGPCMCRDTLRALCRSASLRSCDAVVPR
jgi:glyoxylase-like metal-dependent hydrolase (beta-lactamase superfamily II)